MGVGDISEVQGGAGGAGVETGSGDSRPANGERDTGVVDGRGGAERGASGESDEYNLECDKRRGLSDGAGEGDGDSGLYGGESRGAHGMLGNTVAVGDIGDVQGGARCAGVKVGSGDSRSAIGERYTGVVDGRGGAEQGAKCEYCKDREFVNDSARD